MSFTDKDIQHIASLAGLYLPPEVRAGILEDLKNILEYVRKLEELDTEGVEPMAYASSLECGLGREDKVEGGLSREEAMRGAPDTFRDHFRVPKVL